MAKRSRSDSFSVVGGSSLLVVFTLLCLTVFALLSLATSQMNTRLADAEHQAVEAYYAADTRAELLFAQLRDGWYPHEIPQDIPVDREETPNGVSWRYSVPIDEDQMLEVELLERGGRWQVDRWQAVSTADWTPDDDLPVWTGELDEMP